MVLCGQQEEERWKEAAAYTASTYYHLLHVTQHNLDTYQNCQWLIENRFSRHVWLKKYHRWSHKLLNHQLIFKTCGIKASFDAYVYELFSFKAISPLFNVCTVWFYTLSQCITEQNQLGSHIIIHWRSDALGFGRKLKLLSS